MTEPDNRGGSCRRRREAPAVTFSGRAGAYPRGIAVHAKTEPAGSHFGLLSPRSAAALGVLALLLAVGGVPLSALADQLTFTGEGIFVALAPFAIVGFVLARRVPCNPIGWLLLATALAGMFSTDAGFYALRTFALHHHGLPFARAAVFCAAGWFLLLLLMPLPIALFPDGQLPRRWRRATWCYVALCAVLISGIAWEDLTGVLASRLEVDSTGELAILGNSPTPGLKLFERLLLPIYLCFFLAWVARLVINYRRSGGAERQQLKWLFSGAAISVAGLVVGIVSKNNFVDDVAWSSIAALPAGIGVGVLRYRLYEIDRLLSRTLSYAILTGMLVGVFVGIVVLTTHVLPFSSPVGVAASTLAAAALFNPLRLRVQRLVDRRFNRARYDAEMVVVAFTTRLRDSVELDTVGHELVRAVEQALEPASASLWIRPPHLG